MEYEKFLELNKDEMIFALQEAVRCNSQKGEKIIDKNGQVFPFGMGVQKALETVLSMGEQMGFTVKNVDNYGGHIDFTGTGKPVCDQNGEITGYEKPEILGIVGHLDVVPAGDGWSVDPYSGEIKDGKIYGRGTTDDKGPVISCLYAMKALKESGYKPERTIRLILGLDEETDWEGMRYYLKKEETPTFGFTPDADFPAINGEKGMLIFELARKFNKSIVSKGLELRSLTAGTAPNAVPASARAVVRSQKPDAYEEIKEKAATFREETGYKVNCRGMGKSLEITAAGIAAHGAKPEKGLNAVSVLMKFLGRLNFTNEDHNDFIDFYNQYIGFYLNGEKLGIYMEDEPSGKLVFNVGMAEMDSEAGKLTINIRYPVTRTAQEIFAAMEDIVNRYNLGVIKQKHEEPVFMNLDNPIVETMLEVYRAQTGDRESTPMVIGGGTYAKAMKNVIAFGALFPGDDDVMHQKDECLSLERFQLMTKIYAQTIYKLSQGEYNI